MLPYGRQGRSPRFVQTCSEGMWDMCRLLAIMGPSGGGKTTLLNVLAGQLPAAKGMDLYGRVSINQQPRTSTRVRQAYVQQEDIFYSQLTVRETLLMAAHLRMPAAVPASEKDALVESLIKRLGLVKAADTVVGDAKARGLSGGEKKRLSIGVELIASPRLIFADGTQLLFAGPLRPHVGPPSLILRVLSLCSCFEAMQM